MGKADVSNKIRGIMIKKWRSVKGELQCKNISRRKIPPMDDQATNKPGQSPTTTCYPMERHSLPECNFLPETVDQ